MREVRDVPEPESTLTKITFAPHQKPDFSLFDTHHLWYRVSKTHLGRRLGWRMLRHIRSKTRSNEESVLLYATEEATKYSGEWVQQAPIPG
jgi:hypothetical protein